MWVGLLILSSCGNKTEAPLIEGMNPGECSDRADNDSDGWFDCEDSDCEGAPDCEPSATDTSTLLILPTPRTQKIKRGSDEPPMSPIVRNDDQPARSVEARIALTCRGLKGWRRV